MRHLRLLTFALVVALLTAAAAFAAPGTSPRIEQEWWLQGAFTSTANGHPFNGHGSDAVAVWPRSEGAGIVVADIDSGVDIATADLAGALLPGRDFTSTRPMFDPLGHGTMTAGLIAARGDGNGLAGTAPQALVLPLKVTSTGVKLDPNLVARALNYAASRPDVRIINLSIAGTLKSSRLASAVQGAIRKGKIVVAAAGNSSTNVDVRHVYPCTYTGVLCVAGTDQQDVPPLWTNWGPRTVALAAPAVEIMSTWPGNRYAVDKGTSYASPIVAGVCALLWAAHPEASDVQVKAAIVSSVSLSEALRGKVATAGTLSASAALAALDATLGGPPATP